MLRSLLQFIMSMSRLVKFLAFGAAMVLAVSCGRSAKIDATVSGLTSSDVVVKLLNVNKFEVLDTTRSPCLSER